MKGRGNTFAMQGVAARLGADPAAGVNVEPGAAPEELSLEDGSGGVSTLADTPRLVLGMTAGGVSLGGRIGSDGQLTGSDLRKRRSETIRGLDDSSAEEAEMRVAGESVSRGQGGDRGRGFPAGMVRGGDDLTDGGAEAMVGCVKKRMPRQRERIQGLDDSSEEAEGFLSKSGGIVGRGRGS